MQEENITELLGPGFTKKQDMEEFRWRRREECWMGIQHQIRELQVTMGESRELNKQQHLEQITSPGPKETPSTKKLPNSLQAWMTSAPPGLIPPPPMPGQSRNLLLVDHYQPLRWPHRILIISIDWRTQQATGPSLYNELYLSMQHRETLHLCSRSCPCHTGQQPLNSFLISAQTPLHKRSNQSVKCPNGPCLSMVHCQHMMDINILHSHLISRPQPPIFWT